jgi:hypothetical protein
MAISRIKTNSIANDAITSDKLATGGIATVDMADGSVTSLKILDGAIATADIADSAITTAKLGTTLTVTHALGTASAPSITFTGDTNTGIYSPAADTIAFTEGGVESMRITGDGNVCIGTTTASRKLDVNGTGIFRGFLTLLGTGTSNHLFINNTAYEYALRTADTSNNFEIVDWNTTAARLTITPGGNVGIGTTPKTWSGFTGFQIGETGAFASNDFGGDNTQTFISNNAYYNNGAYRHIQTGSACRYSLNQNIHTWEVISSGSADAAITWNTAMVLNGAGNLQFNSGYGSVATAYGCRAWVNFNGQGTVAIRGSGNVSSITDVGTGTYWVNFNVSMPDINYCVQGNRNWRGVFNPDNWETGRVYMIAADTINNTQTDPAHCFVSIYR